MLKLLLAAAAAIILSSSGQVVGQPQAPRRPSTFEVPYEMPAAGRVIQVKTGGNLQAAIDGAAPGDVLVLEAGATFTGNFKLPNKEGQGWVYIISSRLDQLPEGRRVRPADAAQMPKIVSPDSNPALMTVFGSHHYRLAGIEISTAADNYNLVLMGWGLPAYGDPIWRKIVADTREKLPHHIVFDRCYLHSTSADRWSRTGINADGRYIAVLDSRLENFKDRSDSQAIQIWNGAGPYKIVNNFLEASGENIMSGGTDPAIPDLVPADLEVRGNHFYKRDEWNSGDPYTYKWTVKNLFELKNAERVLLSGNVLENSYGLSGGQRATAVVLTVRNQSGGAPWSAIRDVTFEHNIIRHTGIGLRLTGQDDLHPSQQTQRIAIRNNLVENIDAAYYPNNSGSRISTPAGGLPALDVVFANNLLLFGPAQDSKGNSFLALGDASRVAERFAFENNIVLHGDYGLFGSGAGVGTAALNRYVSEYSFRGNLVVFRSIDREYAASLQRFAGAYPAGNFAAAGLHEAGFTDYATARYRLAPGSRYKNQGTDGKDPGPDFDAIEAAASTAISGIRIPLPPDRIPPQAPLNLRTMSEGRVP